MNKLPLGFSVALSVMMMQYSISPYRLKNWIRFAFVVAGGKPPMKIFLF